MAYLAWLGPDALVLVYRFDCMKTREAVAADRYREGYQRAIGDGRYREGMARFWGASPERVRA